MNEIKKRTLWEIILRIGVILILFVLHLITTGTIGTISKKTGVKTTRIHENHGHWHEYGKFSILITGGTLALFLIPLVNAQAPAAVFSGTPTFGPAPLAVTFTDQSTGSPTGWAWYFGDENYSAPWVEVNASPGWFARDHHTSVVLPDGNIVIMGGDAYNAIPPEVNDTWRSTDNGITWTEMNASSGWPARDAFSSVALPDGNIVLMGGGTNWGNTILNDVWRSTDEGATWTEMNASAGWAPRYNLNAVALTDGSILVLGGNDENGITGAANDVWRSTDEGATWTEVNASAGWATRDQHASVVMPDGSIVLMGGNGQGVIGDVGYAGLFNDTWRSTDDGATWTMMNGSAPWAARCSFSSVALPDDSIVLMGGDDWSNYWMNDSWRSTDDGSTWTQLPNAGWLPRYWQSSVAMPNGNIVLMGGNNLYNNYCGDVWSLTTAGSSVQNPSHTYTAMGNYNVTLQAYNAEGYSSIQRAGYITVPVPAPVAGFSASPTSGAVPFKVTFTDQSLGSPSGWAWYFGDENFTGPWTQVNAGAAWPAREGASSVAMPDGGIVLMGGSTSSGLMNDIWRSTDNGITWTEVNANPKWTARMWSASVAMPDDSIVLMGGYNNSGISDDVWRSADNGITWAEMNTSPGWSPRYGHSSAVLPDGSIVLMGGWVYTTANNDTWRSTDEGATWTEMTGGAAWPARMAASSVALPDGSIVLMGGRATNLADYNDTWLSTDDGATWTEMNASSGWSAREYASSVAMPDGSIVLSGGIGSGGIYENDTWRSTDDGATWTEVNASAGWTGRFDYTSVVIPDGSIVLMGGKDKAGYENDVWRYTTAGSSLQNPSHTYTGPGTYRTYNVTLQAYNAGGFNSTQMIGYITVIGSVAVPKPIAGFSANVTSGVAPLPVSFTDQSSNTPTGWAWFFGDESYTAPWTEVTASAEWSARYMHTSVVMPDGSIVLMGGYYSGLYKNDTWRSTDDGATWTQMNASAGWSARYGHSSMAMPDGSIILSGGIGSGGIYENDTWRSTDDGLTWTQMNASAGWSARSDFSSVVASDGSIVLMGGTDNSGFKNDVWRSTDDGATWTQMNASAGWSPRAYHSSVTMPDGSIVLMGGVGYKNDTWRSTDDGATWTEINASAGWSARSDFSSVVMPDGSIVLTGGVDSAGYRNDIWRSTDDGATWAQVNASAGWSQRGGHTSVVMPDGSIVLTGGWDGSSYKNDVWQFMPAGSTGQNPTHTYIVPGTYNVSLQAYNAGGFNSTQKPAYIIVTSPVLSAGFSASLASGPAPLPVSFTDTSTGSPTGWNWSFGDGSWFNTTDPVSANTTHVYQTAGTYPVSILVTNSGGSSTSSTQMITVGAPFTGPAEMFRAYPNRNGTYSNSGAQPTGALKWVNSTLGNVQSSPAVANGVVFVGSNDYNITAWNATTGIMLWNFTTADDVGSSPAVANGIVYVASANWGGITNDVNFYALDAITGQQVWNYSIYSEPSSPAVVDGVVYVTDLGGNVYALNAASGGKIWSGYTGLMAMGASPAVANGTVYFTGGSFNPNSVTIFALNATDGTTRWQQTYDGWTQSTPAIENDRLFVTRGYNLTAINAMDGTIIWSNVTDTDPTATIQSSPAVAGGMVYVGSNDGNLYALDAATGIKIWNFTTGGAILSSPAVANGVVYVGSNDDNVYALDAATGAKLWNYTTGGHVESCPVIDNGTVYVGSDDGNIYAIGGGLSPAPVPGFTATVTSGAAPLSVTFTDTTSVVAGTMWNWSFGDSTWFNATVRSNPSHAYNTPGTYTVTLTVTNASGSATATQTGYIHVTSGPQPVAAFSGTPTTGTVPLGVSFTDQSTGSPTGWAWFFGDENYTGPWTEVNASPSWNPRAQATSVVMPDGSIVQMGGLGNVNVGDVWRSTDDGTTWTEMNVSPPWAPRISPSSVVMPDGTIVLMGGQNSFGLNDTWQSKDEGATWTEVNASSGWYSRYGHSSVVMPDGTIVLMGGYIYNGNEVLGYGNDVWQSKDEGATWTEVSAGSAWTPRRGQSVVAMPDGSIVLMGGTDTVYGYRNDTWRSTDDGATWAEVDVSVGWSPRLSMSSVAMPDGSIVLMGGWDGSAVPDKNDVWRSTDDGATWTEVNANANWPGRSAATSVAMPDGSIVLMGGAELITGYSNDIWRLAPEGSNAENPMHTYTTAGTYSVALQAYNAGGYNSTQKTGYVTVTFGRSSAPTAGFTGTPTSGSAPLAVSFSDLSSGSPTGWAWFFGDENYTEPWTEVNASAAWPAREDASSVVMPDGSIVLMGGLGTSASLNDVWRSTDEGKTWTEVNTSPGWSGRYGHASVVMPDGSIVLMGGAHNGLTYLNDTWRSTDEGKTWTEVNASSGWAIRYDLSCVAMPDGSIVLTGGYGSDGISVYYKDDVWRSTDDGTTWKVVNASAGWSGRFDYTSVTMPDGSIVLMGGCSATTLNNDVWRSTDDGTTWTEVNASAGWLMRDGHRSVAMPDGSIVLMGGFNNNVNYVNDVWRSTDDGTTWTEANASAGWTAREEHTSVAMPDGSIVLMGGDKTGNIMSNDVWRFMPAGSSVQNPSHTYTVPGIYNVSLQAYNAGGYNSTQEPGYITVKPPQAPAPVAGFSGTPTTGIVPLPVTFKDQSTGSPTGWAWFFGDENYTEPWSEVNVSAGWSARSTHSSVVMPDGSIVLMGGSNAGAPPIYHDVWRSTDNGATWTRQTASAGWSARFSHTSVAMPDGSIVLMGGEESGGTFMNDTWRSTDNGATWALMNASSGWTARDSHSSVVMPDGSIVLMGGFDWKPNDRNDVWRSTDNGATWALMNASSGWTARDSHSSVVMPDGSIVLMGGEDSSENPLNDVWRSTDNGATWTQQTAHAGWSPRLGHASVLMPDGSIILMGGYDGGSTWYNDTWRSTDNGATWTKVNANSGWPARDYFSSLAMPDGSIVLMGGWNGIISLNYNDVWRFMPAGSSVQNPSHTYTSPGIYQVSLQAYNAGGYNSTQKTVYITVTGPAPKITTSVPASAFLNSTIYFTVTGTNFETGSRMTWANFTKTSTGNVVFNNANITINNVTATSINGTMVIGSDAPPGTWNLTVSTLYGGTSPVKTSALTVSKFPTPMITSLTPVSGNWNTTVAFTITGTNFQDISKTNVTIYEDVTNPVTVLPTTLISTTPTSIVGSVQIPNSTLPGSYNLNVTTIDGGTASEPGAFTVGYLQIPTITSLTPTVGLLNSTVGFTIIGTNFEPGNTVVAFSNQTSGPALNTPVLSNVTSTKITGTITIPNNAPTGPYRLDITTTDGGIVNKVNAFTVNPVPAPTITSITPISGLRNSTVGFTITGTNFELNLTTVNFTYQTTGAPLNTTVLTNVTSTKIIGTIMIPWNAPTGFYQLAVNTTDGGGVLKVNAFTVNPVPAPTITAITPTTGAKNSTVLFTLTGTNFEAAGTTVSIFDNTSDTVLDTTLYSITPTTIIGSVMIPANVPAGLYTLGVTTVDGGAVTRLQGFTVNYLPLPVITTLTPAMGYLNSTVPFTLTGNNFQPGGGTVVMLRMVGTTLPASLTFANTTTVQGNFTISNTAGTGSYILYVITTDGGFNSKPSAFTVTKLLLPTITAVTPAAPWYRNATVSFTIAGTNFEPGLTTVAFDYPSNGTMLNSTIAVNTVTTTTINGMVVVPYSAPTGAWNVSVTTADGGQVWKSNAVSIL